MHKRKIIEKKIKKNYLSIVEESSFWDGYRYLLIMNEEILASSENLSHIYNKYKKINWWSIRRNKLYLGKG